MKKFLPILFFLLLFITTVPAAQAQPAPNGMDFSKDKIHLGSQQQFGIKAFGNPNATLGNIISNFVLILFIVGGLAVLVFLIWGAFDWITSGGDKEKVASARRKIMNAFIGLALLALSGFLVTLIGQIVGFDPLNTDPLPRLDAPPTTSTPAATP